LRELDSCRDRDARALADLGCSDTSLGDIVEAVGSAFGAGGAEHRSEGELGARSDLTARVRAFFGRSVNRFRCERLRNDYDAERLKIVSARRIVTAE
jgi:hypothetical protein